MAKFDVLFQKHKFSISMQRACLSPKMITEISKDFEKLHTWRF